ncbi:hypothetical protein [Legionella quateirensis]|uniref:Uncharacterized protein n=1 Tax=Legionella quateirensis TaxID=45072 RepID=A0A378KZA1_9GAMM|nr:hypothetical protein [Legionella quateirensis]KTD44918.1 hypothetical protein Lqua_2753 [Legionella quateirensis]STY19459.1 Uncharacterised protein [Legionella quateirensis]
MEHYQDDDIVRVKELLRHTGEFIAYFELAETKMLEWREEIEQQNTRLLHCTQTLHNELASINELLSQAGAAKFRITAEKALAQGEANLHTLERSCNQFTLNFQQHQEKLKTLTEHCIDKIEKHTTKATQTIAAQLARYDVHQFHRIASESCDHVERVANDAVNKSNKLLSMFQLRFGLFAVFTTLLTAFVIVLYLSDELPWEMHHQAMNEREAGKVLLQAWPNLSQEEKEKILNDDGLRHG